MARKTGRVEKQFLNSYTGTAGRENLKSGVNAGTQIYMEGKDFAADSPD